MKFIIQIFLMLLVVSSCKTKKDIPVIEKEKVDTDILDKKSIEVAPIEKPTKSERLRKPKIDPEKIVAQLNMTEAQESSFLSFWDKNQAEMDKLRSESNGDRSSMREKMKAFRESSRSEIEKILTPEQFAQYKQILARDRMKSRRGN